MHEVRLCALDALTDPGCLGFEPYGVFVVRRGAQVFAYLNRCPHRGIALEWVADQFLDTEQRLIQCATHGALFRIETGECIAGPCTGQRLTPVSVTIKQGGIWVAVDKR